MPFNHITSQLSLSDIQPCVTVPQVFLWPIGAIFLSIPFIILTNFNPARFTLSIYFG